MHKSLILFSSIDGHTKSICKKISEHMGNDEVDISPFVVKQNKGSGPQGQTSNAQIKKVAFKGVK